MVIAPSAKFSDRQLKQARYGVLSFSETNRGRGMTSDRYYRELEALQRQELFTPPGSEKEEHVMSFEAPPSKHRVVVNSWDVSDSGVFQLPTGTLEASRLQVVDGALRTPVFNFFGKRCEMSLISGSPQRVRIREGSYSKEQLFAAVTEALQAYPPFQGAGRTMTIDTDNVSYQTIIAKTGTNLAIDIPAPEPGDLLWVLGYRTGIVDANFTQWRSTLPLDLSTLQVFALTISEMPSTGVVYAQGASQHACTVTSSHSSGSICRVHAAPVVDTGMARKLQTMTLQITELQSGTILKPSESLWSFTLDLW